MNLNHFIAGNRRRKKRRKKSQFCFYALKNCPCDAPRNEIDRNQISFISSSEWLLWKKKEKKEENFVHDHKTAEGLGVEEFPHERIVLEGRQKAEKKKKYP